MLGSFLTGMSNLNVNLENTGYNNNIAGFLTDEDKAFFESCEGIECEDGIDLAFPRLAMENAENFYNIALAVTVEEANDIVGAYQKAMNEGGEVEVVTEAGKFKSVLDKIKAAVKKAWEKIKGVFAKVFNKIKSWAGDDEKFVEKYKPIVSKFAGSVKFKGYNYNFDALADTPESWAKDAHNLLNKKINDEIAKAISNKVTAAKQQKGDNATITDNDKYNVKIEAYEKYGSDLVGYLRATTLEQGKTLSDKPVESGKFNKEIDKFFKNGSDEKEELTFTKADADKLLGMIKYSDRWEKMAKASYQVTEAHFTLMLAQINETEKSVTSAEEKGSELSALCSKACGFRSSLCNAGIAIANTICSTHIKNITGAHSQAREVVTTIASATKNGTVKAEGASLLEGFDLI